jgi:Leucine-rich repeat (LRR) protein
MFIILLLICILIIFLLWIVYSLTIEGKQTINNKRLLNKANKEQMKKEIEEIKMIQLHPKFYIANYFSDLKRQVDLVFALKLDETDKYMKIINTIELVEQECYSKIKHFNQFNNEIDQAQINNDMKQLNDIKFKIETEIFKNKTIHFFENFNKNMFLLIINSKYLRKSTITSEYLKTNFFINRENLIDFILIQTILNSNDTIIQLNTYLINLTEINFSNNQIKEIDENTFHGLINLTDINFKNNQIQIIHSGTFKGLINLKRINFDCNRLYTIDSDIFNGLTSLIEINFRINGTRELHPSTFKDLINLKSMDFRYNNIHELDRNIFTGLKNLRLAHFNFNIIQKLHPNIFNGLINLENICFGYNKIKEIYPNTFNGLINLVGILLYGNQITRFDLTTFDDLPKLKYLYLETNFIKDQQYFLTISSKLTIKGIHHFT